MGTASAPRKLALALAACGLAACRHDLARPETSPLARDLAAMAAERGASLALSGCRSVDGSRVTICEAQLSAAAIERLRQALTMGPFGSTPAPGPPFGQSRCLDGARGGDIALITAFPWIAKSHYRYLLIVAPKDGGKACVETEEGYS
jgi:hypothetical protein